MPEKGPRVFLDYNQPALDAAYDQAAYAANREQLIKRRIRDSELARFRVGEPVRFAYGATEVEQLDIYRTERSAAPIFIFIHGGAWRTGRAKFVCGRVWSSQPRTSFFNPSRWSLSPMTPIRINTKQHTRPAFGLSPKNAIPMIAVPAVPMPTKAA